jgi:toxin YoeB
VAKKKKNKQPESISVRVVRVTPGFTTQFKEDLGWWFKTDAKKASRILDLVSTVMTDPFQGVDKPEPLNFLQPHSKSKLKLVVNQLLWG